jgi:Tfp pilus assembly protein PilF
MPRNRLLQRLLIQWQNVVSDLKRGVWRSAHRTRDAVSSSVSSVGRGLTEAPKKAQSGTLRTLKLIPSFFASLWRSLLRTPAAMTSIFKGAARQARDVGDSVKTSVKGAQVQAQEQPADLGRGMVGFWRRIKAFIWDRPVWARILILIILVGILSAPFAAKPAYYRLVAWRAERLAERALVIAADGRDQEAFDTAMAAFLLNRRIPMVNQTLAKMAQAIDHPQALDYLSIAVSQPEPSPEIIALFVGESIRRGNLSEARPFLSWLQKSQTDSSTTIALKIRYFMAEGQQDEALREVRSAVVEHPADTEILSLYAALALDGESPETTDEGFNYLHDQSDQDSIYGRTALRILLSSSLISGSERTDYSNKLLEHPLAERDDRLLAYSSLLSSKAVVFSDVEADISALFDLSNDADLRDLGRWLLLNDLPDEALNLLPESKAKSNKQFFQVYLTAMLESGRGQVILDLLSSGEPVPLSPVERLIYQAGVQKNLGLEGSFETAAGLAIARAEARDFSYLQRAIEYFDNETLMLDFFRRVSRDPRFALLGKSRLLGLAYQMNRNDIVESLIEELRLRDLRPYPQPQNTLAYIKLLRREDIDEARRTAENLVARYPTIIDYRVTLALAYLRSDDSLAARDILNPDLARREGFHDGWKVVIAALLAQQGKSDDANELAKTIQVDSLTSPEREFLEEIGLLDPG